MDEIGTEMESGVHVLLDPAIYRGRRRVPIKHGVQLCLHAEQWKEEQKLLSFQNLAHAFAVAGHLCNVIKTKIKRTVNNILMRG